MITVYSSHGELAVEPITGLVIKADSDYYDSDPNDGVRDIVRFDIEEFCIFWGCPPQDADILDMGFWTETGDYVPPSMDWRLELVLEWMCDIPEVIPPDSGTPGELHQLYFGAKQFGAIPKQ